MNVITIEEEAFLELVRQVVAKLKEEEKEPDWIDGQTAMTILGIGKTKLQELRHSGAIRYSQPSRKIILYFRASLLEYLQKHAKEKF